MTPIKEGGAGVLRDLGRSDWLEFLSIPEERAPQVLLLRGTRNLKAAYARHAQLFTDVMDVGSPNGLFEDVLIGSYEGVGVAYASVYGDAMASEVTHLFGVLGARSVIQTGCCGATREGILPGDLVCATSAYCGEGAARCYLPSAQRIDASPELAAHLAGCPCPSVSVHQGSLWTTAALLAEGRADLERWAEMGCIAADMETASTFAIAEYFGMRRASLLFVFDNPQLDSHLLATGDALRERRSAGERAMLERALALIRQIGCDQAAHTALDA